MQHNRILVGDAVEKLRGMDDESVHAIVTSPPYWQQRDYENIEQIGHEPTVEDYVENIVDVAEECYRVLRDDGSFMLNIGDAYDSKERQLIPHRVAQHLSEDVGFVVRQDLVWEKSHGKPDPATDRRARTHEYVFHFTKNRDYWYDQSVCDGDHTSVITADTATSNLDHTAVYSEEFVEDVLRGVAPPYVCSACGKPYLREFERVPRPFADPDRKQSKRARELFEESELTEDHIEAVQAVGISDVGKAAETEDGAGRNRDSVEILAAEAKEVLGGYYREFTMIERIPSGWQQACSCDGNAVGGVVCDPFVGSGTTVAVAKRLGYQYLGIDVNSEYVEMASLRVAEVN